eukprot:NODE_651_length_1242_cov_327.612741_g472_i0.p1 GENE.NODE_651_length_1242_cov_327.612741_g472_i0~~NODE_651_length_1242_cov_327.612741_g472_i0.p1  ORF type:complete len:336 (-),score=71.67 NODE_651_length_1242_cov_327.612741_g472_i0:164-1171(-)
MVCLLAVVSGLIATVYFVHGQSSLSSWRRTETIDNVLLNDLPDEQYYAKLLDHYRGGCGEICNYTMKGRPGKFFDYMEKTFDCRALYGNPFLDRPAVRWPPPRTIPACLYAHYTMGGRIQVRDQYIPSRYTHKAPMQWTPAYIEGVVTAARNSSFHGGCGPRETSAVREAIAMAKLSGQHILVVGTLKPWVEALLLVAGVRRVTTLEYGPIISTHPRLDAMQPAEFNGRFLNGTLPVFDASGSFSSLEHPGLGRYGDLLNPYADLMSVAKVWCAVRKGGKFLLGVPFRKRLDRIWWNANRVYGPIRLPHLASNWHQLGFVPDHGNANQQVWILQK